jgi:hypothetical protein
MNPARYLLQAVLYTMFMSVVWYLSTNPVYRPLDEGEAVVIVAFGHAGKIVAPCRVRSAEELAALPPNMRVAQDCPRERSPINVEVILDDKVALKETFDPPGFYKDLGVEIFHRTMVPVGKHRVIARMNDDVNVEGFTHVVEQEIELTQGEILVVEYKPEKNTFVLH